MAVAYTALVLWFFVAILLFRLCRPPLAALLTLLGAALFLPNGVFVDLPGLPPIGKEGVASIACLGCCLAFAMPSLRRARLGRGPEILLVGLAIGTGVSVFTNLGPHVYGPVNATDFVPRIIGHLLRWGVPFIVGRALFSRSRDARDLLVGLAVAGVAYSLFILVELRLSPQFHRWTYGFHQHLFSQAIRAGGYRPQVFMAHGLHLSLFVLMSLSATLTLARLRYSFFGVPAAVVGAYLTVILVLCKSLGSITYSLFIGPLVLLASPRLQMRVAVLLALLIIAYPLIRASDLVSAAAVADFAEPVAGERRVKSLTYRLETEDAMIEQIQTRLWFGFSNVGRAMLRDEVTGRALRSFDGFWIVSLTAGGVVELVCVFGLLLIPVFRAWHAFPRIRSPMERALVAGLSLMVTINVVDLLPNSTTEGYLTLLSGALAGIVPGILREQARGRRWARPPTESRAALGDGLVTARDSATL